MMIFGLDVGTTSVGFNAVIYNREEETGEILHIGVRVFPEARDPKGIPLNQERRAKRMMRRQLRRRRERRRGLNELLAGLGLLPAYGTDAWNAVMAVDPYDARARGLAEALSPHAFGRALYHLAKRRHFRGRDLPDDADDGKAAASAEAKDEAAAQSVRESLLATLKKDGHTLGQHQAGKGPHERRRGLHASRGVIEDEFDRLWRAQAHRHPQLTAEARAQVREAIFFQRPVFWRLSTLGACRLEPDAPLAPKASWLSQQRRMLESLNNLAVAGGNARTLDAEERAAIRAQLERQGSMTWPAVRKVLEPLFKARGLSAKHVKFNLELSQGKTLLGNPLEAKLAGVFGAAWEGHPHRQAIRDLVPARLWEADYGAIGQRVVIRTEAARRAARAAAAEGFVTAFGATPAQAEALAALTLPSGWDAFSSAALERLMPHLNEGARMGDLLAAPQYEAERVRLFPRRERPTGAFVDTLPSPAVREERVRQTGLRNPTVVRVQNELRKVVNNLIRHVGRKPDLIRIELAREVGLSARERDERSAGMRRKETERKRAIADLQANGLADPSRDDVEKWLLWHECQQRDPYTGDHISFSALFRDSLYEVEHIWPRHRSMDDSFRNKTLCRKDVNQRKGNRTPYEAFHGDAEAWKQLTERLDGMVGFKGKPGLSPAKVKRFTATEIPEDFASRQLNDTGFAARAAAAYLKQLWPDVGPDAPVTVQVVSGRVTAALRHRWGLNNLLSGGAEKTRDDHRHHAIDALVVACADPGMTQRLARAWQAEDEGVAERLRIDPPWPTIRADAEAALACVVVSHRVRKKVSGALHAETVYGDTGLDITTKSGTYRRLVTRKPLQALSKSVLAAEPDHAGEGIVDPRVREIVRAWVAARGGDPAKAFPPYPRLSENGPEIRKVRVHSKQQIPLLAQVSTGFADLAGNHHAAIFRKPDGSVECEVVPLFEAARRSAQRLPVVARLREGAAFVMSLAPGDSLSVPVGPQAGIWIVTGVWASTVIVLERHTDAASKTTFRPTASSLMRMGARKISVDPIGRVRPASD